jgi:hypothetical protein
MTFYDLKKLNIKLLDFICLLSPLGVVNKIVSNGEHNLVELEFHQSLLKTNGIKVKGDEYLENSLIKLYNDNNHGFIINQNTGIFELPFGIKEDSHYIEKLNKKNSVEISKYIRKNFPKDCHKILKKGITIEENKYTDPTKINLHKIPGYKTIKF